MSSLFSRISIYSIWSEYKPTPIEQFRYRVQQKIENHMRLLSLTKELFNREYQQLVTELNTKRKAEVEVAEIEYDRIVLENEDDLPGDLLSQYASSTLTN